LKHTQTFLNETELITQLQLHNRKAFEYLYDNYSAALYGVVKRVLEQDELAQDTLQEAFVKIWKNIEQYDPTKSKLFTWMLNIARNAAIDKLRSKSLKNEAKTQPLEQGKMAFRKSDNSMQQQTDTIGLKNVVQQLKPEQQEIIELMYFQGYSQSEIAENFNIPLGTVKTRARAALQLLRQLLEEK
jgi:RNA polymerase sigma-70 factor, ECF subfamily